MDKESRDASGYQFSTQASDALDKIEFTPEGVKRFFIELSKKPRVELSRYKVCFFIRGGKVCLSKMD
jgi:hypothetical protein